MEDFENTLQEKLERFEAGEPLEQLLKDLPDEEAELIRLAIQVREIPVPERDVSIVAAQKQQIMQISTKEDTMGIFKRYSKWLVPAGAVVLIFFTALFAVGTGWLVSRGLNYVFDSSQDRAGDVVRDSSGPDGDSSGANHRGQPNTLYIPAVTVPEVSDPHTASLKDVQGLVQVSSGDDKWENVQSANISSGQRVRTGPLSRARVLFYDGSWILLGANTAIAIDQLNAQTDGPREIEVSQMRGETDHVVAPSSHPESSYSVHTPTASGFARGTAFQVLVSNKEYEITQINVLDGSVEVTGENETVLVEPGQVTTIADGEEPEEPVFHITGEGIVEKKGETWVIAGLSFGKTDLTEVVGHPLVGDLVYVEGRLFPDGTRVADRIVLLRRNVDNQFTLTGRVGDDMNDEFWIVAGQKIFLGENPEIEDGILGGDLVRVEGIILEGGILEASKISLVVEEGLHFEFTGIVQEIGSETLGEDEVLWKISGIDIYVNADTAVGEGVVDESVVRVEGVIREDGTWLAMEIELVEDVTSFEFVGTVETIDPWKVSGIDLIVEVWTSISPDIEVGDLVLVIGEIMPDGTWVASEIRLLDKAVDLVFFGHVESMGPEDPWIVSGITLPVNELTRIVGEITIGSLVRVEVAILEDGSWQVVSIELIEGEVEFSCVEFTGLVEDVTDTEIVLASGISISLEDAIIDGKVVPGATILVNMCFSEEIQQLNILIIVLQTPEPPTEPPTTPEPQTGEKAIVCHRPPGNPNKAKTLSIGASAVNAHLGHGDTMGPCP